MRKWEYKYINMADSYEQSVIDLNQAGQDGWELAVATHHKYLLKREIVEVVEPIYQYRSAGAGGGGTRV